MSRCLVTSWALAVAVLLALGGCGGGGGNDEEPTPTPQSQHRSLEALEAGRAVFDELSATVGAENARQQAAATLKTLPGVADAGAHAGEGSIWLRFDDGTRGAILTSTRRQLTVRTDATEAVAQVAREAVRTRALVAPRKALVLSPFNWDWRPLWGVLPAVDDCDYIRGLLDGAGYDVTFKWNTEKTQQDVSVSDFKGLQDYGVVHVNSHGGVAEGIVNICTGERVQDGEMRYASDLSADRLILVTVSGDSSSYYAATPSFFTTYTTAPAHCLVSFESCDSTLNNTMADAFVRAPEADVAFVGWNGTVGTDAASDAGEDLFARLLLDAATSSEAMARVAENGHATDPRLGSNLTLVGGGDVRLVETPLRVAVTAPQYDDLGAVLSALGHSFTQVELADLDDAELNSKYDLICVNCAAVATSPSAGVTGSLAAFVNGGGRLYASDFAAFVVTGAFPGRLVLYESPFAGTTQVIEGTIRDPALAGALGVQQMTVDYDLGGWVPVLSVSEGVEVLVAGSPEIGAAAAASLGLAPRTHSTAVGPSEVVANSPLAVRFTSGSGTVIYTTFHNHAQASELVQRFLEHLVLFK